MEVKLCNGCSTEKPYSEFGERHDRPSGVLSRCKKCCTASRSEYRKKQFESDPLAKERYIVKKKQSPYALNLKTPEMRKKSASRRANVKAKFKKYVNSYLDLHPCVDCGNVDTEVLTFDHVRDSKSFNIGNLKGSPKDYKKFDSEILKCEVRCINCHNAITKIRQRGRLYCFLNNLEYKAKAFTARKTEFQSIYYSEKPEIYSQKNHQRRSDYYEKYLPSFVEILKQGCTDCGTIALLSMQFDHIRDKYTEVGKLFFCWQIKWELVLEEMAKCELVCGNCHRKRTNKRLRDN